MSTLILRNIKFPFEQVSTSLYFNENKFFKDLKIFIVFKLCHVGTHSTQSLTPEKGWDSIIFLSKQSKNSLLIQLLIFF